MWNLGWRVEKRFAKFRAVGKCGEHASKTISGISREHSRKELRCASILGDAWMSQLLPWALARNFANHFFTKGLR